MKNVLHGQALKRLIMLLGKLGYHDLLAIAAELAVLGLIDITSETMIDVSF